MKGYSYWGYSSYLFLLFLVSCFMLLSCTEKRIKEKITALQSVPIVLRSDSMICLSDSCKHIENESLKWIVYRDSSVCKPCQIAHISDRNKVKENNNVECVFIFSAKGQEVEKYEEAYEKMNVMISFI